MRLHETVKTFAAGLREGSVYSRVFMRASPAKLTLVLLASVAAVWIFAELWTRTIAERANQNVEIAIDVEEVAALCQRNDYDLSDFLARCRTIGVTSVIMNEEMPAGGVVAVTDRNAIAAAGMTAVQVQQQLEGRYRIHATLAPAGNAVELPSISTSPFAGNLATRELPLGFSRDKMRYVAERDYRIVLRPQNSGRPMWIFENLPAEISGILCDGKEVPGYPGEEREFCDALLENGIATITVEFTAPAGIGRLKRSVGPEIVIGHVITPRELNTNLDPSLWIRRWVRAVRERNVRFLVFHFWDTVPIENNLNYLRSTAGALKQDGFVLDQARVPEFPMRARAHLRLGLALLLAMFVPLIALRAGIGPRGAVRGYLLSNTIGLAGGCAVAALLFDIRFMQKIIEMPMVKPVMLVPIILAGAVLYSRDERRRFWFAEVRVLHVVLGGLLCAAAALLLIRSGNNAAAWLQPDQGLREFFENLLTIRPRTKEFLFGQPLLLLGLVYRRRILIWLGIIGQVSILNTFLHAHTPVVISLVRTIHGIWLGLVIGGIALLLIEFFQSRIPLLRRYR